MLKAGYGMKYKLWREKILCIHAVVKRSSYILFVSFLVTKSLKLIVAIVTYSVTVTVFDFVVAVFVMIITIKC